MKSTMQIFMYFQQVSIILNHKRMFDDLAILVELALRSKQLQLQVAIAPTKVPEEQKTEHDEGDERHNYRSHDLANRDRT